MKKVKHLIVKKIKINIHITFITSCFSFFFKDVSAFGIVLEAPFFNVLEEVELHPFAKVNRVTNISNIVFK